MDCRRGLFSVGNSGTGTLNITGGGGVSSASVSVMNNASLIALDIGKGSSLTVSSNGIFGNGTLTNNGTVRLLAGAGRLRDPVLAHRRRHLER